MKRWTRVTCCPKCGGNLLICEHFTYSVDYKITKKGVLSKRGTRTVGGPIDCMTAFCEGCYGHWDGDHVLVECDDTVFLKLEGDDI